MSILTVITASISRCLDLTFFGVTPAKMGPEWPLSERRDFLAKLGVSIPLSGALIAAEMRPAKSQSSMMMTPQEIAGMAVYLGSQESSGMTGQSIHIDGGMVF